MSDLRKLSLGYVGLLALLALTVGSSLLDLGGFNVALNLAIAAAKSVLIAIMFMHLTGALPRLAVAATGLWLVILFGLTLIGR
ncbi:MULTISPECIES: cytochrome C oxidase subunit IV family protein [Mesorhizobium]|uniref:Caa(3)-type oxidase, subunit IV n=1 Tax=Mesorhizobium opportunistum (strain LMG 24607 / HAMBI 3007 / WSM2075) TaxID=536019 RepID=F7Y6D3_MESOW|nr:MULTISPECIES: cytochrome C oxidase subunit IV family protein [Mesorhizobium]AEH90819.1 caa(3)-type oxidase, subunit IV [Mesorhizobium opportunistum WSM2075]MCA0032176.1 cytochrome C oxidase subunit IV family protein [Mesorhizobium sp. B263B2A]TPN51365.1 caa(3)-type oxidase subunit IV [Mesorhizobium sp. B1-1-7]TPN56625.1 caa(3)-type oxidase subunit IV [Mesorhizobium sp. B1-1-9]